MSEILHANKLFNPKGNDDTTEHRNIIKGSTTGLFNLNATKYPWAKSLYQVMIGNFWVPEKVSGLKDDARMFHNDLSLEEQRAYKGILSFLIFLDSIQTVNLPHFLRLYYFPGSQSHSFHSGLSGSHSLAILRHHTRNRGREQRAG
jgi:ribonucleoside-diphosphate reductase beta chain